MNEPDQVLDNGTKVVTCFILGSLVSLGTLSSTQNRRTGAKAILVGFIPGTGGDVYWGKHQDGTIAPYGWWEFELEEEEPISMWERL